ncbi:MAG: apolipoprotein N-acyltransferase [Spirochaetales bacterium]|nr:apolipoprotein N-acyltransferase [Spirochaetales bacterium]MCF7937045.1 apolipoprotein N-acyltransferase [Spirochaetales bacterium]
MKRLSARLILLTVFSSFLFTLAQPNQLFLYGSPLLGIPALIPLFFALQTAERSRHAALLGALFGGLTTVLGYYWLLFFQDFAVWTLSGTAFVYILFGGILGMYLHGISSRSSGISRGVLIAALWVGYEYLKSVGFLGFPWGLSLYPFHKVLVLNQIIDITGIWGVGFLVVLASSLATEFLIRRPNSSKSYIARRSGGLSTGIHRLSPGFPRKALLLLALLYGAALIYGTIRLQTEFETVGTVDMVLVQQNINPWERGNELTGLRRAQRLSDKGIHEKSGNNSETAAGELPDLLVWSETTLRRPYSPAGDFYRQTPSERPFTEFISELKTPLLVGAPVLSENSDGGPGVMNGTVLIGRDGSVLNEYGKQHPVPFAESVPFWEFEPVRRLFQEVIGLHAIWSMGQESTVFEIKTRSRTPETLRFSTPICFEDAFPRLNRHFILQGADLLINLTNDAWAGLEFSQSQHFVVSRYRTIESRHTLVRATNGGLTSVVDAHGRLIEELPMFEASYLRSNVPVYRPLKPTVYIVYGDWLPWSFIGLIAVWIVYRRYSGSL